MSGTRKDSARTWVIAGAVWAFLSLWTMVMTGSFFADACMKPGLDADQRLFRCGWAQTLLTPVRLLGDPPEKHAGVVFALGTAQADRGDHAQAVQSYADAIAMVGLATPVDPSRDIGRAPLAAGHLLAMGLELPPGSAASTLFFSVLSGALP